MKYEIVTTPIFIKWMKKLKDRQAVKAIAIRMDRAILGNLGDIKPVAQGVSEMRIFVGKGYRVYFVIRNNNNTFAKLREEKTKDGQKSVKY